MKELVLFSLKRRFLNKTNKVLLILLTLLFSFGLFLDKIVDFLSPSDHIMTIRLENIDESQFLSDSEIVFIDNRADIIIKQIDQNFIIESENILSDIDKIQLESLIYPYYQSMLSVEIQDVLINYRHPQIEYQTISQNNLKQKHDHLFVVITMIYFMMIGFAGLLAQEVVAEKTSNILEMIGTSVSLKTHYYSKIIIGWLSIMGQFIFVGFVFIGVSLIRLMVDNGQGLIAFLVKHQLLEDKLNSFSQVIKEFLKNPRAIGDLGLSLLFLFIGILIIQLILVVVSTKVTSVEEAGALQNPFYIGLLFLYYGAMILNTPSSMMSGWGFFLSFIPITSMIFMPSRIMIYPVSLSQILMSLIINIGALWLIIKYGERIYVENVLNFTQKKKKLSRLKLKPNSVRK